MLSNGDARAPTGQHVEHADASALFARMQYLPHDELPLSGIGETSGAETHEEIGGQIIMNPPGERRGLPAGLKDKRAKEKRRTR